MSRDVRDVVISSYHYTIDMMHSETKMENFLRDFLNGKVFVAPYRDHILNYRNYMAQNYENIEFFTYEWVTGNIEEAIKKAAKFLGKEVSEENMEKVKEHLKFDNMKSE